MRIESWYKGCLSITLLLLLLYRSAAGSTSESFSGIIPKYIQPITYSIGLTLNLKEMSYTGRTQVMINISQACDQIPIHSKDSNITDVFLASFDDMKFGKRVLIEEVLEDKNNELLRIYSKYVLYPGIYILMVDFESRFSTNKWGFYDTSWVDDGGWDNTMVATQFSPYHARTAWPCFDEPALKARFKFFVEHESVYTAVSNMAIKSRVPTRAGWVRSIFEWTPPMSTYITALVITNFRYLESSTSSGVMTRVYANPSKLVHGSNQLDMMTKLLEYFEEYFGVNYSLDKLDMMPLPQIAVAAMENWGLMTARTDIALFNPAVHGAQWELTSRIVIAHEVAHMWFGDLVTPRWWDHIPLKESTVSWFMAVGVDALYDDFNFKDEYFVLYEMMRGMDKDSSVNSREMTAGASTNNEIMGLFDRITYNKGGSIFRMIHWVAGEEAFRSAIHNYLSENAFATATLPELNKYINDSSLDDIDMVEFIDRYTRQKNYPLVHVSLLNGTHVLVKQERFLHDYQDAVNDSPYNYTWHVPFTYTTDAERNDQVIILKEKENVVKLNKPARWIKANNDFRMYYVTNYDLVNWSKLYHQLMNNHLVFTTTDRIQLLSDLLNLVPAEQIDIIFPLQFLNYIKKEREFGPWKVASDHWTNLLRNHMTAAEKDCAKIYMRDLVDDMLMEVVQMNTSFNKPIKDRLLQFLIVDIAMKADHPLANQFIDKLINQTRYGEEDFGMVFLQKLRRAATDKNYWSDLFESALSLKDSDPDSMIATYTILAHTDNSTALKSLLRESLIAPPEVMQNVLPRVVDQNPLLVWNFFKQNYDQYYQAYGESQFIFAYILQTVTERLDSVELIDEVTQFFKSHSSGTGEPGLTAGLEQIRANIRWKQNQRYKCRSFFFNFARKHARKQTAKKSAGQHS